STSGMLCSSRRMRAYSCTFSGSRIAEVPGQPITTRAPSIHWSCEIPSWFSRFVNWTTWDVSKSTIPTRITVLSLSSAQRKDAKKGDVEMSGEVEIGSPQQLSPYLPSPPHLPSHARQRRSVTQQRQTHGLAFGGG